MGDADKGAAVSYFIADLFLDIKQNFFYFQGIQNQMFSMSHCRSGRKTQSRTQLARFIRP